jgi:hypothetical protein
MFKNNGSNYVIPKLDLYYSKKIGEKDELSINVVGSHYTTNTSETAKEWITASGLSVYDNDMVLKANRPVLLENLPIPMILRQENFHPDIESRGLLFPMI